MKYAEYVVTGWVLTAVVLAGYWLWIVRRTKRAEASWRAAREVEAE
ncbi:MAG: heme exporter protein CcmD [Acidimicrobiia bacterium]